MDWSIVATGHPPSESCAWHVVGYAEYHSNPGCEFGQGLRPERRIQGFGKGGHWCHDCRSVADPGWDTKTAWHFSWKPFYHFHPECDSANSVASSRTPGTGGKMRCPTCAARSAIRPADILVSMRAKAGQAPGALGEFVESVKREPSNALLLPLVVAVAPIYYAERLIGRLFGKK